VNKKEEVGMARKEAEMAEEQREDAKSFFYPPEEEDMPQEIKDMEDRFQRVREQNRKIFGEPVFEHDSTTRGFVEQESGEEWEMLAEARPIEVDHKVDGVFTGESGTGRHRGADDSKQLQCHELRTVQSLPHHGRAVYSDAGVHFNGEHGWGRAGQSHFGLG
jgi:hypothetical protein